jgi:hypothetical protein
MFFIIERHYASVYFAAISLFIFAITPLRHYDYFHFALHADAHAITPLPRHYFADISLADVSLSLFSLSSYHCQLAFAIFFASFSIRLAFRRHFSLISPYDFRLSLPPICAADAAAPRVARRRSTRDTYAAPPPPFFRH